MFANDNNYSVLHEYFVFSQISRDIKFLDELLKQ